jgi:hypothetical protein
MSDTIEAGGILLDDIRLDTDDELTARRDYWQSVYDRNTPRRNVTALMSCAAASEALCEIKTELARRNVTQREVKPNS